MKAFLLGILGFLIVSLLLSYLKSSIPLNIPIVSRGVLKISKKSALTNIFSLATKTVYKPVINFDKLEEDIKKVIETQKGDFSVMVTDLTPVGPVNLVSINADRSYLSASLYKLWLLVEAYKQIESGKIHKDSTLSSSISDLYDSFGVSTQYSEKKSGRITISLENALNKMITVSENDSALLVNQYLDNDTVVELLNKANLVNSKMDGVEASPTTTPADIESFLAQLYYGKLINPESTSEVFTLLKAQKLNSKIPLLLPKDTVIAHKTGELFGFSHDAGVVYTSKGDYLIVVFTDTHAPLETNKVIGKISKLVYEYYLTPAN